MVISADTSFLFSLYGNDVNSPAAVAHADSLTQPISLSRLNVFELSNAFRHAEFRKAIKPGEAALFEGHFQTAIAQGRLVVMHSDLHSVLDEAEILSSKHSLNGGHRGFDILQVAAAKTLSATDFLTFDANQKKLALAEGMNVPF